MKIAIRKPLSVTSIRIRKRSSWSQQAATPAKTLYAVNKSSCTIKIARRDRKRSLMVHQLKALQYAAKKNHPAFFMHMRLGKTLTAIRWIAAKDYINHIVVIAPLTVLEAWERELTIEGESYVSCYNLSREKRIQRIEEVASNEVGRKWLLINYELVRSLPMLTKAPFDVVILDESTRIKNPKAQITELCCSGFRNVLHRIILTGLPKPESELDIFCQFRFLHGSFAGCSNYYYYRKKYFYLDYAGKWQLLPEYYNYIKRLVHEKAFVLTRQDAGIGEKKVYETRYIELSARQRQLYKEVEKEFAARLESGEVLETQWITTAKVWMSQIAGGFEPDTILEGPDGKETRIPGALISSAKTNEIIELLNGEIYGQKVIIWYRFRKELHHDALALNQAGFSLVTIHGDVPQEQRKSRLEQFRGNVQVCLAMETVARYGLDCSVADIAIYRGNEWSCESRVQSEDRIVHPHKKRPLLIIDLVARGTIDEEVAKTVRGKAVNAQMFMHNLGLLFKERLKGKKK